MSQTDIDWEYQSLHQQHILETWFLYENELGFPQCKASDEATIKSIQDALLDIEKGHEYSFYDMGLGKVNEMREKL